MKKWDDIRNSMSGNSDIIEVWKKVVDKHQNEEIEWIENLRKQGYKASHPNDGWVDRENNKIYLAYPQFNDGIGVNDKLMIGSPNSDNNRPVRITGKLDQFAMTYYLFEDLQ